MSLGPRPPQKVLVKLLLTSWPQKSVKPKKVPFMSVNLLFQNSPHTIPPWKCFRRQVEARLNYVVGKNATLEPDPEHPTPHYDEHGMKKKGKICNFTRSSPRILLNHV